MHRVYFDNSATTPVLPEVFEAMRPYFSEHFGNASSIHHHGQETRAAVERARDSVASLLGCRAPEVVFTSGGTEADNLAIRGIVKEGQHVVTTAIEHPAVLNTSAALDATFVPVGRDGVVDPEDIRKALRKNTVLISVMHGNNEIGTVQPLCEISIVAREAGVLLHSDGVQAVGRIPVNVNELGVDLYSMSGHKLGAPKGIGALYVRDKTPLSAISFGGHHERERRPGTENVAGAVALGVAAGLMTDTRALRDQLEQGILARVPRTFVNGANAQRLPNTTNICFEGIEGEALLIALKNVAVSSGSACTSASLEPSYVLKALGVGDELAHSSIRFGLGRFNTEEEVDFVIDDVVRAVNHLRDMSPLYEMHKQGIDLKTVPWAAH